MLQVCCGFVTNILTLNDNNQFASVIKQQLVVIRYTNSQWWASYCTKVMTLFHQNLLQKSNEITTIVTFQKK